MPIKFKVGDTIRMIEDCSGCVKGKEYKLVDVVNGLLSVELDGMPTCSCQSYWELITNKNNATMNLKEKFILALTKEPQKSFRIAGVTNGDDILTEDGQKVFLSWLLHSKFAEEFKKDVVDTMLKEVDKEKK